MLRKVPVPDHLLNQKAIQQLSNHGMRPPCKVAVSTHKGSITLSGQIQYEHQRRPALRAVQNIEGVQRVVDQLQVTPKTSHWKEGGFISPSFHF